MRNTVVIHQSMVKGHDSLVGDFVKLGGAAGHGSSWKSRVSVGSLWNL